MAKIIAGILAFLLWIFPNWSSLQNRYELLTFSWEATANNIMNAVKTNDITALEAMMCRNIKQNIADLPGEISKLLDTIDGEITTFTWKTFGAFTASHGIGKSLGQMTLAIDFTTSAGSYRLGMMWEYSNSFQPKEKGIRNISVHSEGEVLALITATNGVGEWHE